MEKNLLIKITMVILLPIAAFCSDPPEESKPEMPQEMFVFTMPKEGKQKWEKSLFIGCKYAGLLVMEPEGQNDQPKTNPKEMVVMSFYGPESGNFLTLEQILPKLYEEMMNLYPQAKHMIKVIEKSETDLLAEYSVIADKKGTPVFYSLGRYHTSSIGVHSLAFVTTNFRLSDKKKKLWFKAIKNQASVKKLKDISLKSPEMISLLP